MSTPVPARWLLALLVLAVAGAGGWHAWRLHRAHAEAVASDTAQQLQALHARVDALRRDQRAQAQRLQQADATNRVLRDELLGLGQRAALLEDNVRTLAEPQRGGAQAVRLEEVELLLVQGGARLQLAGDLAGARRAYALAADVLAGIDDPALLNLRQALAQERSALDAPGADPAAKAGADLDAFAAGLGADVPPAPAAPSPPRAWWQRAFAHLVQVRPSDPARALASGDRAAGFAALQLELALARSALERRDVRAWRAALLRADGWLLRLWPDSPQRRARRDRLRALGALPLQPTLPTLGTTLQQLRALHEAR